jgi:hypothetical protein
MWCKFSNNTFITSHKSKVDPKGLVIPKLSSFLFSYYYLHKYELCSSLFFVIGDSYEEITTNIVMLVIILFFYQYLWKDNNKHSNVHLRILLLQVLPKNLFSTFIFFFNCWFKNERGWHVGCKFIELFFWARCLIGIYKGKIPHYL